MLRIRSRNRSSTSCATGDTNTWGIPFSLSTTLTDKFLPARATVVRVFSSKWPTCVATATENGFPKVVKRNGTWDFVTECVPCKAEDEASRQENDETDDSRFGFLPSRTWGWKCRLCGFWRHHRVAVPRSNGSRYET
jgi:hypothetical protein